MPLRTSLDRAARWALVGGAAVATTAAFGYVGGWLAPQRLTPQRLVDTLQGNGGLHPGFRRNHAKGVCVAGWFEGNGAASAYSRSSVFARVRTPVTGRFAIPGGNPYAPDGKVPIRSLALRFDLADGQQWRTGMNAMPVFPVSTPAAFHAQALAGRPDPATGKPDPAKLAAFHAAHPETAAFRAWAKHARPSASYATERYNSINAFHLVDANGRRRAVRWSMVPVATDARPGPAGDPDCLARDLQQRLAHGAQRWILRLTFAAPGDPVDDAARAWPADRPGIDAGTLVIARMQAEDRGACRDMNFDPTVLPSGIEPSADPLLAARAAAYAESHRRRTAEQAGLPGSAPVIPAPAGEEAAR